MNTQWKKRKKNWKLRLLWLWYRLRGLEAPMIHYINGTDVLPAPLTPEQEDEMTERLVYNDQRARGVLVEHNLRLVVYIAKKFENTGVNIEDLISIGTIGLIKAVNTFCKNKSIKLATYASRCIENEILMYIRANKKRRSDVSLSDSVGTDKDGNEITLMDVIPSCDDNLFSGVENRLIMTDIKKYVSTRLKPREKKVMELRYGLNGERPHTQLEVADILNISRSYVSRIEKKAIKKISDYIL